MRNQLLGSVATAMFVAFSWSAAQADVNLLATVDVTKTIDVTETIDVTKNIVIQAQVRQAADKAAESLAAVNQTNHDNTMCSNCAEKRDTITDSFSGNSGITTFNQSSGNMNNQGNAISAAVDFEGNPTDPPPQSDPTGYGYAEAQASADQRNQDNTIDSVNLLFRDSELVNSVNGNSGVVFINQAPGNGNNQANTLALAVSFQPEGTAISESDLGQLNSGNTVGESRRTESSTTGITKNATIDGSLNGNQGIIGVNQASGNLANQANITSVSLAQGT